jgi:hypothetical protein
VKREGGGKRLFREVGLNPHTVECVGHTTVKEAPFSLQDLQS